jgi:hypothetical protein
MGYTPILDARPEGSAPKPYPRTYSDEQADAKRLRELVDNWVRAAEDVSDPATIALIRKRCVEAEREAKRLQAGRDDN